MTDEAPLVLVADDEIDIVELVDHRLRAAGYEVAKARDGREALALAKELEPDLAVLDVMMPHMDGYEVTAAMRADDRLERIPVIFLTARVQDRDVERGFRAGAEDYIKKPFSPQELRSRVQAALGRR